MIQIFADFEATDKNPYTGEIIAGYFESVGGKSYEFFSQVKKWNDEAEKIHKITEFEAMMYLDKKTAYNNLLKWLPKEFELICYANYNSQLGYMLYDVVILQLNLMDHLNLNRMEYLPIKIKGKSVHSMAKEAHRRGLIDLISNGAAFDLGVLTDAKKYQGSNRVSYRQITVHYSLFGEFYDAHDAKADVKAMIRIYKLLDDLLITGKSNRHINQLELI